MKKTTVISVQTAKAIFGLSLCVFLSTAAIAQTSKEIRLNILNPGIAFENPIGKRTTVEFNFGVGYN
jgi:hypothetical protein